MKYFLLILRGHWRLLRGRCPACDFDPEKEFRCVVCDGYQVRYPNTPPSAVTRNVWLAYYIRLISGGGFRETFQITCPDCGPVRALVDAYEGGKPACGTCPRCGDTLYFA